MINESLKTKQAETVRNDRFDRICSDGRHISKRATDYIPAPKGKGEKVKEMKNYVIGVKNGRCVVASEKEIIENNTIGEYPLNNILTKLPDLIDSLYNKSDKVLNGTI